MESTFPESGKPKEIPIIERITVPPEIIRPLGRALQSKLSPHLQALQNAADHLKASNDASQADKERLQSSLDEANDKIMKIERAKEVKLIGNKTDPDLTVWTIECSKELETSVSISASATVIGESLMKQLGPALQDYLIEAVVSIKNSIYSPPLHEENVSQIGSHSALIIAFLRKVTNSQQITITNTGERSVFTNLK